MFNWNDLTFFLELARQGRLRPTARALGVDYTTVSRRISELEKSLAVALFERRNDGFVLTKEGRRLQRIALRMENISFEVNEEVMSEAKDLRGRVRIASMEGLAAYYLSERFCEITRDYPNIELELVTERFLLNLTKREADISISFAPPIGPRITTSKAGTFKLGLFASRAYLSERGMPASAQDLQSHDFVDYVSDLIEIDESHWLLEVLDPECVTFRSTSMAAQQNAVVSGQGIALLPYFSAKHDARLIPVLHGQIEVSRNIYISVHEDVEYLSRVKTVTRFLHQAFKRDEDHLTKL